jgi:hypothetical protein
MSCHDVFLISSIDATLPNAIAKRRIKMAQAVKQMPTPNPKPKNDKTAKLRQLAATRVPRAVKAIGLVGNLAAYSPTNDQVTAIAKALTDAVEGVEARLRSRQSEPAGFKLP